MFDSTGFHPDVVLRLVVALAGHPDVCAGRLGNGFGDVEASELYGRVLVPYGSAVLLDRGLGLMHTTHPFCL